MKKQLVFAGLMVGLLVALTGCAYILAPFNQPPTAYITSISPAEVTEGETVEFSGYGTDVDGEVVGYRWRSDLDGELSRAPSFQTDALSVGEHTIYFSVQDNAGAWSEEVTGTVTVLPEVTAPVRINSFSASLSTITAGDSVTLSWNVSNATTVTIDQGIGSVPPVGSVVVSPGVTTTYRLTAIGGGVTVTADVTINVLVTTPDLEIVFFEADPEAVQSGQSTTLSWETTGATQVQLFPLFGAVDTTGSVNVTVEGEQTYIFTLVATDGEETVTAQVTVVSYLTMPTSHTVTLIANISESGYVRSTGVPWANYIYVGDDTNNIGLQGFVSFDISDVPGDAMITNVVVDLSNRQSTYGTPFADLGCLRAYVQDYGELDGGDYFTGVATGAIGRWCSQAEIDTPGGGDTGGFQDALQDKIGEDRFQIRLQFNEMTTDGDNQNDLVRWYGDKLPQLVVTYYSYE